MHDAWRKGYRQFSWFGGCGYLVGMKVLHCPQNPTELDPGGQAPPLPNPSGLLDHNRLPELWHWEYWWDKTGKVHTRQVYWNNYDHFYRRNFWNPGHCPTDLSTPPKAPDKTSQWSSTDWINAVAGATRNLIQAYPPADTVVTWCPYHHRGYIPTGPGDDGSATASLTGNPNKIRDLDMDLVLLVDGSVRRVLARQDAQMWQTPSGDLSWPHEPVM